MKQKSIRKYILSPSSEIILKNDSIGNYITYRDEKLLIEIEEDNDVYYQKDDFSRVIGTIYAYLKNTDIRDLMEKLLDCEVLVLINEIQRRTHPVEQIFLDINEKSQLLEVEDIFKGHCFEKYEADYYADLKNDWVNIKKCSAGFKKLGYDNTSKFIYLYLLEHDSKDVPENLMINGDHYLYDKEMDTIDKLLKDMIAFGNNILKYYSSIYREDYRFIDICSSGQAHSYTNDHIALKEMGKQILEYPKAQYQKLPFLFFINYIQKDPSLKDELEYKDFRSIISNLYVYSGLFIIQGLRKSKSVIDHTLKLALLSENDRTRKARLAAKELRNLYLCDFEIKKKNIPFERLSFVYSIIDNYDSNNNWIKKIYVDGNDNNLEHLIVHDNKFRKIKWLDGEFSFTFSLPTEMKVLKRKTINYLILNTKLNESLKEYDIVSKINMIEAWYNSRDDEDVPNHILLIIEKIKDMSEYESLVSLKGNVYDEIEIEAKYLEFVNAYFSDDNEDELTKLINTTFKESFQN